jgi:surface polysaccharide O-acyltransferase-like enzyme
MNRLQSIDVMRVIAIIAVIVIHTVPFAGQPSLVGDRLDLATIVNQLARFAVPFFFIVSGYLWACKCEKEGSIFTPTAKMAKRIIVLLTAWSVVYLLVSSYETAHAELLKQFYWSLLAAIATPLNTALQGSKDHLWFLPGLLCGLVISAVLIRYRQQRLLVGLAIALYLIGMSGKAYSHTPLGFQSSFNFRNGPYFSLIFFVTGYFLAQRDASSAWLPIGMRLALFGILLQLVELFLLHRYWGTTMVQDYVVGTYFYGLGIAMMALSGSRFLALERIATLGPFVLGIYASHILFLDLLAPVSKQFTGSTVWSVINTAAVFLLSYMLVLALSRFRATRRFVM